MRNYAPAYTQAALDTLLGAGRSRRSRAIAAVERLCLQPHQARDCVIKDIEGKECQVLMSHDVLLTYWVDDAVCEVRILAINWIE